MAGLLAAWGRSGAVGEGRAEGPGAYSKAAAERQGLLTPWRGATPSCCVDTDWEGAPQAWLSAPFGTWACVGDLTTKGGLLCPVPCRGRGQPTSSFIALILYLQSLNLGKGRKERGKEGRNPLGFLWRGG